MDNPTDFLTPINNVLALLAAPLAGALLVFLGAEMWRELKILRRRHHQTHVVLARIDQRLEDQARRLSRIECFFDTRPHP